jgi:hypothetical protein
MLCQMLAIRPQVAPDAQIIGEVLGHDSGREAFKDDGPSVAGPGQSPEQPSEVDGAGAEVPTVRFANVDVPA